MANVVVLTDDPWVENEVLAALSDPGTQVHVISDPRKIEETVAETHADVAVIDLQVGAMGGMAVIRALRVESDVPRVRTVLLLDRSADEFLARRAGADAHVLKPFTSQQLRAALALPAGV
ncbi:MAG: response regulator [Actinomycetota bacterium]